MNSAIPLLVLAFGLVTRSFAAEPEAKTISLPEVKPADTWTYVFSELPSRRVVTEFSQEVSKVDATSIVVNMRRGDAKPDEVKYGRDWLQTGDFRVYEFPLELGKTWSYTRSYNSRQCGPSTDELTAEVKGWEDVEVPAGKFRALKIEHNGTYKGSCGTGVKQHWYWYVPAVKRHVKYEQHVFERPGGDMTVGELIVLKNYTVQ